MTKVPEIEAYQNELLKAVPDSLNDAEAVKKHTAMLERASFLVGEMKTSLNGEEWEWKARVHTEEEELANERQQSTTTETSKLSLKDVLAYQRTGRLPDSMSIASTV